MVPLAASKGDILYFSVCSVFILLTRLLSNGCMGFHQIFTKRRLLKIDHQFLGVQTVYFLSENYGCCMEMRRNSGKTKTNGRPYNCNIYATLTSTFGEIRFGGI